MGHYIQGRAEETRFAQPGEEKAGGAGGSGCNNQLLKRFLQARWSPTSLRGAQPKSKSNGHKMHPGNFSANIRKQTNKQTKRLEWLNLAREVEEPPPTVTFKT